MVTYIGFDKLQIWKRGQRWLQVDCHSLPTHKVSPVQSKSVELNKVARKKENRTLSRGQFVSEVGSQ
jgi:hypothetical protein